jgi:hypothetical protein
MLRRDSRNAGSQKRCYDVDRCEFLNAFHKCPPAVKMETQRARLPRLTSFNGPHLSTGSGRTGLVECSQFCCIPPIFHYTRRIRKGVKR